MSFRKWNNSVFYLECTESICTPSAGEVLPDLFEDFQRSITWNISIPERTVLTLEFPVGLAALSGAETCPNSLQYSVVTTKSDGTVKTQHYCKSGTVSHLEMFRATTVTVDVPKEEEVEGTLFTVKAAQRGKSLICFQWTRKRPSSLLTVKCHLTETDPWL